eukprot:scaffold2378_cov152-Skeletonema_menzelii.AAC.1
MKFATPLTIALVIANNVGWAAAATMMMTTPGSEPETETEMELEVLRPHGSKGEAPKEHDGAFPVEVFDFDFDRNRRSLQIINLARQDGAIATQSCTSNGGVASRAVDGRTSGVWTGGSVTATCVRSANWWMVDLGADKSHTINSVTVYNRVDCTTPSPFTCYANNIKGSYVEVLNHFGNIVLRKQISSAGDWRSKYSFNFNGVRGRYVRVQKSSTIPKKLFLAEAANKEANQEANQEANKEANQEANQEANNVANNKDANQEANNVANNKDANVDP